ncbi:WD40 domain protein [Giardia muris]|uniref:WD40 domain protein n=1 Tax=Giardia muris TaxID=5742 RepID=A0A4Z1T7N6_GIAMU|nr:WD40 domain protein [Giardia muris]|eukprot:TNJ28511.1 WD40 domain protein [Giardia muris]
MIEDDLWRRLCKHYLGNEEGTPSGSVTDVLDGLVLGPKEHTISGISTHLLKAQPREPRTRLRLKRKVEVRLNNEPTAICSGYEQVVIASIRHQLRGYGLDYSTRWISPALHLNRITTVATHLRQNCFVTGSDDKTIKLYDSKAGTVVQTFINVSDAICTLACSKVDDLILAADASGNVAGWTSPVSQPVIKFAGHKGRATVSLLENQTHILTGGVDGLLRVWDLRSPAQPLKTHSIFGSSIVQILVFGDVGYALCGNGLYMFSPASGELFSYNGDIVSSRYSVLRLIDHQDEELRMILALGMNAPVAMSPKCVTMTFPVVSKGTFTSLRDAIIIPDDPPTLLVATRDACLQAYSMHPQMG